MQYEEFGSERGTLESMLDSMEGECKTERDAYEANDNGIEALRRCVRALEAYANQVRDHEKESVKAHGRYRRAFIQTYALLKSVLDKSGEKLNRFQSTFEANHTKAA